MNNFYALRRTSITAIALASLAACSAPKPARFRATVPLMESPAMKPTHTYGVIFKQHNLGKEGILRVVMLDPKQIDIRVHVSHMGGLTADTVAAIEPRAVAVINGPYFNVTRGVAAPHLYLKSGSTEEVPEIAETDAFFPENVEVIFVLDKNRGAYLISALSARQVLPMIRDPDIQLAIQTGPVLISGGHLQTVRLVRKYPDSKHMNGARKRTLLGVMENGDIVFATIAGGSGVSLDRAAHIILSYHSIRELVNLDGGPMTQMVVRMGDDKIEVEGESSVPAFLVAVPKTLD